MHSPDSNITMISKKAWETKGKEAQDKIFMRLVCDVDTDVKGRTKIQPPIKQDLSEIQDPKEKRLINKQHKITLAKYNEDKKKEMLLESKITGLPPLNINGQIKKKKNQKNSPTANTTPKRYNRIN